MICVIANLTKAKECSMQLNQGLLFQYIGTKRALKQ